MSDPLPLLGAVATAVPGWFGKLPALGDFAGRRLPEGFTASWDRWLSASITASQAVLGERWLYSFLHAPVWRFCLTQGIVDDLAWVGVLMPSVDRVGRYFPLTIAAPAPLPSSAREVESLQQWLKCAHDVALSVLDASQTLEGFEDQLAAIGVPGSPRDPAALAAATAAGEGPWPIHADNLAEALGAIALTQLWRQSAGTTLWWCAEGPAVLVYRGMPDAGVFRCFLAPPIDP